MHPALQLRNLRSPFSFTPGTEKKYPDGAKKAREYRKKAEKKQGLSAAQSCGSMSLRMLAAGTQCLSTICRLSFWPFSML